MIFISKNLFSLKIASILNSLLNKTIMSNCQYEQYQNLNSVMDEYNLRQCDVIFLKTLKFKNSLFRPDDDIVVHQKIQDNTQSYGKILLIAKHKKIQFPVLLVAWYYNRQDPLIAEQQLTHLGKKQLILSSYEDWIYMEAVKCKMQVVDFETYKFMDPKERSQNRLYFCRNYLSLKNKQIINELPERVCYCMGGYNPDQICINCPLCRKRFHPICAGHEHICPACQ